MARRRKNGKKPNVGRIWGYQNAADIKDKFGAHSFLLARWLEVGQNRGRYPWQVPTHLSWIFERDYMDWRIGIFYYKPGRGWFISDGWQQIHEKRFGVQHERESA